MKVYLAGEGLDQLDHKYAQDHPDYERGTLFKKISNRLLSYYYHGLTTGNKPTREMQRNIDEGMDLFLDSGAYTAYVKGKEVPIEKYAEFVHEHGHHFNVVSNLDVIGDTGPKSWDNLKTLESLGVQPFPVFHYEDDYKYLTKMLDEGYPFIALGGLVGGSARLLREWMDYVWGHYLTHEDGTPRTKVHGFGLTVTELMLRYPWFSVDSSSWVQHAVFGTVALHINRGRIRPVVTSPLKVSVARNMNAWHYDRLSEDERKVVDRKLAECGVTAEACAYDYLPRYIANAIAYQEIGEDATDRFISEQEFLL